MQTLSCSRTALAAGCIAALIGASVRAAAQATTAGGSSSGATPAAIASAPAPTGSASAGTGAATATTTAPVDSAAPAGSGSASTPSSSSAPAGSASQPAYPVPAYQAPAFAANAPSASPLLPPPPSGSDSGTRTSVVSPAHARAIAEAGGIWSQGLDATDSATRQGGFYAGGLYSIHERIKLFGRYSFASGSVVERLPGSGIDGFGSPNDVRVLQSRHAAEIAVGYSVETGPSRQRFWALPFVGPRLLVLADDAAPRTAFEAQLGARAGVRAGDAFEAGAFLAWSPALAKNDPGDVYGNVLAELRFGAGAELAVAGPFGITLGYEGDVITLAHQRLSYHQVLTGLTYAFE